MTLFFLYAEEFSPSVFADLENLLDRVTPLYKARIEELAEQQQVVVSAVADHWAPVTARALADATGLPMASISGQLDRLEKTGFIEKVEIFGQASAGYQIAERFFNIWFLMRSTSRRQRREIEFLVHFIESFYEARDRQRLARRLMDERDFSPDRFQFARALGRTLDPDDKEELARHAELDALRQKAADARRKLEGVIDFSKLPPATLAFDELRERLMALVPSDARVTPEEFAEQVLGDRQMFIREERERLAATGGQLSKEEIDAIRESIDDARKRDEFQYGEPCMSWLRQRLASGQLRAVQDLEDWNRSFLQADGEQTVQLLVDSVPSWIGPKLNADVCSRIRRLLAPSSGSPSMAWHNWGFDLHLKLGCYLEAEAAYRKAIDLTPRWAHASTWNSLGNLYSDCFQRYSDAAAAYTRALEIDDADELTRNNLVFLLRDFLGDKQLAKLSFQFVRTKEHRDFDDTLHLHEALFAAYDLNWGLVGEALAKAIEAIGQRFPYDTADDWFRASAVLMHLNYGEELLAFLRERGDDVRLRPWYEALFRAAPRRSLLPEEHSRRSADDRGVLLRPDREAVERFA